MAMATGTALALGGGALLGGIAGGGGSRQTTSTSVPAPNYIETSLQEDALQNYLKQQNLINQQEASIKGGQNVQQGARGTLEDIFNGTAYDLNPAQMQQIENVRNANIAAGMGNVNEFIQNQLQGVNASAAERGVRGQALSELQGRAIGEGARQVANLTAQANQIAAQQSMDNPYRQAQLSGGLASQNSNFMEQLRQNAINNRNVMQNPALMQYYQSDRMGSPSQTTSTPGSFGSVLGGALGGAGSIAGGMGNLMQGQAALNRYPSQPVRMAHGGFVPGHQKTIGDSIRNDVVDVKASPGEMIIPVSFAHDEKLSKAFVEYMHRMKKESKEAA